jgi:squalene synthase HpnC
MVEEPTAKGAGDENFPVGSWLIAAPLRPHVRAFYAFARAADDIADHPALSPADKLARLEAFDAALAGDGCDDPAAGPAVRMRASLGATGVDPRHCLDLLGAFRQDVVKHRYADWDELMRYCARSASPVGRYLLDLHGEDGGLHALADPLCDALQVLNHLQDSAEDYRRLDRIYLPGAWLAEAGVPARALKADRASPALRAVLDRCLEHAAVLLEVARELPRRLRSTRLALESAVILSLAERLTVALRRGDPLARRVELGKPGFALAAGHGLIRGAAGRVWSRAARSAATGCSA